MTTPRIVTPSQPDPQMIELIHRGHDGWVSFARKVKGEHENIASLPANALPGLFDQMIPLMEQDGFFSINGTWKSGDVRNEHGLFDEHGTPLRKANHKTQHLRWLTAIYADIDTRNRGLEAADVIGEIIRLQDADEIPPVSIITRSGGGLWLFWLLAGKDSHDPVRAYPEKVAAYSRIQRAFNVRFASFGADSSACDAARITRIPGSINTKRQFARVGYWVQFNHAGTPFTYTLEQLAAWCGVSLELRQHQDLVGSVGKNPKSVEKGHKGQAARWKWAADNFRKLWDLRGTWRVGIRNQATLAYATILYSRPKAIRLTDEQITEELEKLYADMEQPADDRYSRDEFRTTVQAAKGDASRRKSFRLAGTTNQTFANWLDITPDEAAELPSWPCAAQYKTAGDEQGPLSQSELRKRRRELLRQSLDAWSAQGQPVPPLRQIAELVERSGLPRPAEQTVANDLDALGHKTHRKRRPRNDSKQGKLFQDG